ncbi:MAG: sensor histidine kinase [Fimbriimonas sp.]
MLVPRNPASPKDYELLAATLRSIGDAVLTADAEANVTFMNPMAEMLSGWSNEEAQGHKAFEVLRLTDETTGEPVKCPVLRVIEADHPTGYSNHTVIQGRDGFPRVVSYNAAPIRGEDGRLEGVVLVFHGAATHSEAGRSNERFRLIARATNDAVWDLDIRTGRLWLSDAVTTLFGYGPDDVEGSLDWWLGRVHPHDRERVAETYELAREQTRYFQQDYRLGTRSGHYAAVLERGYVLRDAAGNPVRMLAAVMDVTGRREAQEELLRLNADLEREVDRRTLELRQANRELESFSYSVSHDLRAPLRNILASGHMLEEDSGDALDAEGRAHLARLVLSARRMSDLIDDMLQYSRLSRARIRPQRVDLSALTTHVADEIRRRKECGAEIVVQAGMEVEADPALLTVLLENLIGNACKFSGKVAIPRIEIGAREERGETVFFVRDNGVGFDQADAERLFQPFERLHSERDFPGTGIGLANVRRVVSRHGGRAWAEGTPGKGATFYFTLA